MPTSAVGVNSNVRRRTQPSAASPTTLTTRNIHCMTKSRTARFNLFQRKSTGAPLVIPTGWSWPAALFSPLWAASRGLVLWAATLAALLAWAALLISQGNHDSSLPLAGYLLLSVYMGAEGRNLLGKRLLAVVGKDDLVFLSPSHHLDENAARTEAQTIIEQNASFLASCEQLSPKGLAQALSILDAQDKNEPLYAAPAPDPAGHDAAQVAVPAAHDSTPEPKAGVVAAETEPSGDSATTIRQLQRRRLQRRLEKKREESTDQRNVYDAALKATALCEAGDTLPASVLTSITENYQLSPSDLRLLSTELDKFGIAVPGVPARETLLRGATIGAPEPVSSVNHCAVTFSFVCNVNWHELQQTSDPEVRSCSTCNRDVHLCLSKEAAQAASKNGHCIAYGGDA